MNLEAPSRLRASSANAQQQFNFYLVHTQGCPCFHSQRLLIIGPDLLHLLFEWLQGEFERRAGIPNFEPLKDTRVEDPKRPNLCVAVEV